MNKKEVLVDTIFLEKLSCDGKNLDIFKEVLADLENKPIGHPYIAANELDMHLYFDKLVDEGFVRVASYNEFLTDRKAAMSLGDVHMILMAFFTGMSIILTEDSDINILRSITKRIMQTYKVIATDDIRIN